VRQQPAARRPEPFRPRVLSPKGDDGERTRDRSVRIADEQRQDDALRRARGQLLWLARPSHRPVREGLLHLPGTAASLRVVTAPDRRYGAVHHPGAGTLTAVVKVSSRAYALLDRGTQNANVSGWGRGQAALARTGQVARIQVAERTVPDSGDALRRYWKEHGSPDAPLAGPVYSELIASAGPAAAPHEAYVAISLDTKAARRLINERSADRTRLRQPLLPILVRHVEERYDHTRTLLEHASAADTDTPFTHGGRTYRRVLTAEDLTLARGDHRTPVRVRNDTGQLIHVEAEEETAFWDWATVETLRHSGARIEEMCEVSHLSIRHYQRNNGEMIALLVITPSKTDRERVIPMSAELFHVIASVIRRHTRCPLLQVSPKMISRLVDLGLPDLRVNTEGR
jgi:hypothetical protein